MFSAVLMNSKLLGLVQRQNRQVKSRLIEIISLQERRLLLEAPRMLHFGRLAKLTRTDEK